MNKKAAIIAGVGILLFLTIPFKNLLSEFYYKRGNAALDDKTSAARDFKTISGESMKDYFFAIKSLETAKRFRPQRSIYYYSTADIYTRLGAWAEVMEGLGTELPAGAVPSKDAYKKAIENIKIAITLEPTKPDYHIALAKLMDASGMDSGDELKRAVDSWPDNAYLRHTVAMQHLLTGRNGDALEHARILAGIDRNYMMPEHLKGVSDERQWMQENSRRLKNSYLFGALEIAWRASKDIEVVRGITPDNPFAKEVFEMFLEWRGIE